MQNTFRAPAQTGLPMAATVGSPSHPLWQFDNQKQPIARAESAQSAIESVAQFTHILRQPSRPKKHPNQAQFCEREFGKNHSSVTVFDGDLQATVTTDIGSCTSARATSSISLTIEELEHMACAYLDAAHYLRQQASQGGAA